MDITENKFLLFHCGGGGGDFLCSVINYLYDKNNNIVYDKKNRVKVIDDEHNNFKDFTSNLIKNNDLHYTGKVSYCMVAHHYHPKLHEIFTNSKFYYIDYTNYEKEILERVKKLTNFKSKPHKKFDLDFLRIKQWKSLYEFYKISPLKQEIFFSLKQFKECIKESFLLDIDEKIESEYNIWFAKNQHFFNL